ncbi:MAG: calcium/proton exchanger [Chloroflexota bacterium]|nr:MAG: calcium/proton exchanger [Chloroflexota bacterium]
MFLRILLFLIPIAILAQFLGLPAPIVFVLSFLALIPLASILGEATEEIATYTGPKIGGMLNATLGTLTELIIFIALLRSGQVDVLKASIIGSILMSLLLTVGIALLVGGLKNGVQRFDSKSVSLATTTMILATVGLIVPTLFTLGLEFQLGVTPTAEFQNREIDVLSLVLALILFVVYLLTLVYQLRAPEGQGLAQEQSMENDAAHGRWSLRRALLVLAGATVVIAVVSEILSGAVEPFGEALGLTPLFMGVVILPVAGAVSEIIVCVRLARRNQIDFAISIPMTGAMQVPLFVTPLLVFLSILGGHPLTLYFNPVEVVAVAIAVALAAYIAIDGVSNWLEGAQFLALWGMLALWFYFLRPLSG